MLYAKPLWKYAIDVYSENKVEFLHYQDQYQLCVNDLIVLGFCQELKLVPNNYWWHEESTQNLRDIITSLRQLRNSPMNASNRQIILIVELECEKMDLEIIASQFRTSANGSWLIDTYCEAHPQASKPKLEKFITSLKTKKGAEAP